MNTFTKLFGIAGLTTLTALTTMGMGTVNVLADNASFRLTSWTEPTQSALSPITS